jgi:hypothetical protein
MGCGLRFALPLLRWDLRSFITTLFSSMALLFLPQFSMPPLVGFSRLGLLFGLTFGVSLLFESVGVATAYLLGPHHHTDRLGLRCWASTPMAFPGMR